LKLAHLQRLKHHKAHSIQVYLPGVLKHGILTPGVVKHGVLKPGVLILLSNGMLVAAAFSE